MINKRLAETASSLTQSADLLGSNIESSSERLTDALIVTTETAAEGAKRLGEQITLLGGVIMMASDELKSGIRRLRLLRRINLLTAVLVFVALFSAGATVFYAWETRQLVELMKQELRHERWQRQPSE